MTTKRAREWSYARAVQRIGDTPTRQLLWLLRFADAADLNDSLVSELDTFFMVRLLRRVGDDDSSPRVSVGERMADLAPRIQQELREQLERLRRHGECGFSVPAQVKLWWNNPRIKNGPPWAMTSRRVAKPFDLFFGEVLDLLLEVGGRLRICAEEHCGKMFVAARPHQVCCTARCTNRATQARRRKKMPPGKSAKERREQRQRSRRRQLAAAAGITPERVGAIKKPRD